MKYAVGIDLGTTNSLAAIINPVGNSEIIRDSNQNLSTSTTVLFDDDRVYVGEEAKLKGATKPDRVARLAKQFMGASHFPSAIRGEFLPPEVIQSCVLNKLRGEITRAIGSDFGVVVSVPSFFVELQRTATANAVSMAGLHLMDLVNEPIAAALGFAENTSLLSANQIPLERARVLVYDLGGFTFEASVLEILPGAMNMLAGGHDISVGGHSWDTLAAEFVAEMVFKKTKKDPREHPDLFEQLLLRVERAKRVLALRNSAVISLRDGEDTIEVTVTREDFEKVTSAVLDRTITMTSEVLDSIGMGWKDLSQVLLVGGATRMPAVRKRLQQLTGRPPNHVVNPDEAVARGAAIYAQHLLQAASATRQTARFSVTSFACYGVGIESIDMSTGSRVNRVVIPRGTTLPTKVNERFSGTLSADRSISLTILEGDSQKAEECRIVGKAIIKDLPEEVTDGWPVDVTLEYSRSGRISIDATVRYTDRSVHLEIVRSGGLSENQVAMWAGPVQAGAGMDEISQTLSRDRGRPIPLAKSGKQEEPKSQSWFELAKDYGPRILDVFRHRKASQQARRELPNKAKSR